MNSVNKKWFIGLILCLILGGALAVWVNVDEIGYLLQSTQTDRDAVMGSHYNQAQNWRGFWQSLDVPADYYQGIDVSHWQGVIDWAIAYSSGVRFVFIRAGSANSTTCELYADSQLDRNAVEAPANNIYVDYYWFFRPNCNPINQADEFVRLISGKQRDMYAVLDVEVDGGLPNSEVTSAVWVFQNRFEQLTGEKVMIYTSPGFWNGNIDRNTWSHTLPLWVAHWNVSEPFLPYDWSNYGETYAFWQTHVGDDGPEYGMESEGLDHDVYHGTEDEFIERFVEEEPPLEVELERIILQYTDGTETILENCDACGDYNCYCEWLPSILK